MLTHRKVWLLSLISLLIVPPVALAKFSAATEWSDTLKQYECLQVEEFTVEREDYSSKKLERAGAIPDEVLVGLQRKIIGAISRAEIFAKVAKADNSSCQGTGMIFGGWVTDYKQGNRLARYIVGFGAGKQKFEASSYLKDKKTGEVLAKKVIIDRKIGGWAGGSEEKGESDFARKVVRFIKEGK